MQRCDCLSQCLLARYPTYPLLIRFQIPWTGENMEFILFSYPFILSVGNRLILFLAPLLNEVIWRWHLKHSPFIWESEFCVRSEFPQQAYTALGEILFIKLFRIWLWAALPCYHQGHCGHWVFICYVYSNEWCPPECEEFPGCTWTPWVDVWSFASVYCDQWGRWSWLPFPLRTDCFSVDWENL